MQITKGAVEAEIANAVVKFQREQMGRGAGILTNSQVCESIYA
jgi:uncharacterized protein YbcI